MLEELAVANLGVVERAVINPGPGMNVISGETGAGKTIVVGALQLLLGGRANATAIGPARDDARVDGRFTVTPLVSDQLLAAGFDAADDLVISRQISRSGPSRAWVNGRPVTAATLSEFARGLVAIHGQHDHYRLLSPNAVRDAVDLSCADATTRYRGAWEGWCDARAALSIGGDPEERAREIDRLRHQVDEIGKARLVANEDDDLEHRIAVLANAHTLHEKAMFAWESLDTTVGDGLAAVVSSLRAGGEVLAGRAHAASALQQQAADLARELAAFAESATPDAEALEQAAARRAAIAELKRKYGPTIANVLGYEASAGARLSELEAWDDLAAVRIEDEKKLREERDNAASTLRTARLASAAALARSVANRLPGLSLAGALVEIDVAAADAGPSGADVVTMRFAADRRMEPQPVQKVASGGELSRLMLAIEVSIADPATPVLVFDEVDAGVGGAAGAAIGQTLTEMAARAQVLCVTHLAQVAAFAAHHVVITKTRGRARVAAVTGEQRVGELSRMLAGRADSATGRAHALELLGRP